MRSKLQYITLCSETVINIEISGWLGQAQNPHDIILFLWVVVVARLGCSDTTTHGMLEVLLQLSPTSSASLEVVVFVVPGIMLLGVAHRDHLARGRNRGSAF